MPLSLDAASCLSDRPSPFAAPALEASLNATLVNFREKLAQCVHLQPVYISASLLTYPLSLCSVKGACRFYANSQLEHVVGVSQSTQMVLEKLQRFTLSLKSTLGDG